jgi:hypothetical protein
MLYFLGGPGIGDSCEKVTYTPSSTVGGSNAWRARLASRAGCVAAKAPAIITVGSSEAESSETEEKEE